MIPHLHKLMHFRGKAGCSEHELSKRVMTGPLPPTAAKHDAICKQNRPPSLSCAHACIRSGEAKGEGNEVLRNEPNLAAVLTLMGWSNHRSQTNTQAVENCSKKGACRLWQDVCRTESGTRENRRAATVKDFRSYCCSASAACSCSVSWEAPRASYLWLGSI